MESLKSIRFILPVFILVFTKLTHVSTVATDEPGGGSPDSIGRPLKAGDTFTPGELLPVTVKLIEKVAEPGLGKGIVSASKHAEELADKLFEAFFMTSKRVVILTEFDIKGLDALQALALSGEVANNRNVESVTEEAVSINPDIMLRGQIVRVNTASNRCKYKLLTKNDNNNVKRRGIELAKKLSKKRRLVVKSRRGLKEKFAGKSRDSHCRWRYECSNPGDLDTCQVHAQCNNNRTMITANYIGESTKVDVKQMEVIKAFRKMLKLFVVDEEVEKILETRVLTLKPNNLDEDDRIQSLGEYFYNIIKAQTSVDPAIATTTEAVANLIHDDSGQTENVIDSGNLQNEENDSNTQTNIDLQRKFKKRRF